jgi:lauroyl/myristoyl acyltransferase
VAIRRVGEDRFRIEAHEPFDVPSSSPADLQRATQRVADAISATIRAAPHQWYSFKPMWPATPAEQAELERRAVAMLGGDVS